MSECRCAGFTRLCLVCVYVSVRVRVCLDVQVPHLCLFLVFQILAKHLDDGKINQLPLFLGEPAMVRCYVFLSVYCGIFNVMRMSSLGLGCGISE